MGETRREPTEDGGQPGYQEPEAGLRHEVSRPDRGVSADDSTDRSIEPQAPPATAKQIPVAPETAQKIAKNIDRGVEEWENPRTCMYYTRLGIEAIKANQGQQKIDLEKEKQDGPTGNIYLVNLLDTKVEKQRNFVESITRKITEAPAPPSPDLDVSEDRLLGP